MMTPDTFPSFESMVEVSHFFVGVDLGQTQDPTAVTIVQRLPAYAGGRLALRHLERLSLGTSYPRIVQHLKQLMRRPEVRNRSTLVVDATGVGRPVLDYLRHEGLPPVGIVITGGQSVTWANGNAHVPQKDPVGVAKMRLAEEEVHVAPGLTVATSMPLGDTLRTELRRFRVRITASAHETFGREGEHDDLICALTCACWFAQYLSPAEVRKALGIGTWGISPRW
jgi:hypothetical protein